MTREPLTGFLTLLQEGWSGMWARIGRGWRLILLALAGVVAVGWWGVLPMDDYWLAVMQGGHPPDEARRAVANFIGDSGDLLQFHLAVFALLWIAGTVARKDRWRRAAVASLLAMMVAGLACNILRPTLGRPRPSAQEKHEIADRLYPGRGLPWNEGHRFQSLPSAHTATAFGTAVPILIACPPLGVPVTLAAGAMGWARMVQNQHHPSDILGGACLGIVFGAAAGLWARRETAKAPGAADL